VTISAWRIVSEMHSHSAFDGEGARIFGGRFNRRGTAVVYTSTALSLAILELLVHTDDVRPLVRHVAIRISLEESLVRFVDSRDLPVDWNRQVTPSSAQTFGERWIESGASVALAVPSVLLPDQLAWSEQKTEYNILLNPRHEDFTSIDIGPAAPLRLDDRF